MCSDAKKSSEFQALQLVYGDRVYHEITEHENPDFLVRHFHDSQHFGIEVTEYFSSESSARAACIDGYVVGLLEGEDHRHKEDRTALAVCKVKIVRPDNTVHAEDVPAVIQEVPRPIECAQRISERILKKSQRIRESDARISHANLIIHDRSDVLSLCPAESFYSMYFTPEMRCALGSTDFREIYLITRLKEGQVYAPLKMVHLLAEAYLFNGCVVSTGLGKGVPDEIEEPDLFAAYLDSTVKSKVLVRDDTCKEVIFGDAGLCYDDDGGITVRLYSDSPIGPNAIAPTLDWQAILGCDFVDGFDEYRNSRTFHTEAVFPVISDGA